jgi:hypothetical protein
MPSPGQRADEFDLITSGNLLGTDYFVGYRAGVGMIRAQAATLNAFLVDSLTTVSNITVTGDLTLTCPDDFTEHAVRVRKRQVDGGGYEYLLEIVQ